METPKRKAKILQEIAEALKQWAKYNQKDADEAIRKSPKARQATKNAMELLLDNLGLLYEVRNEYGCHQPLLKLFDGLSDVASRRDKPDTDLGAYWCWGREFTQRQLWAGNNISFIEECLRWASLERAKAKGSQKNNSTKASGGKADLPNSIPAKIWAMLCKLYEISLKVIVDAILDRFWPKPQ
jgi:ribosomal protein L17